MSVLRRKWDYIRGLGTRVAAEYAVFGVFVGAHRPYWRAHIVTALIVSAGTLPYGLMPWVVKYYFDSALTGNKPHSLLLAIVAFIGIQLLAIVVPICDVMSFTVLGMRAMRRLQLKCFSAFLRMNLLKSRTYNAGDIVERISNDVSRATQYGGQKLVFPLVGCIQLAVAVPSAAVLSWQLTVAHLPILAASFWLQRVMQRRNATMNALQFRARTDLNTMLYEHTSNKFLLISGPMFRRRLHKFADLTKRNACLSNAGAAGSIFFDQTQRLLFASSTIVIWALGGWLYYRHRLTIGDILAVQSVLPIIGANAQKLVSPVLTVRAERPAAERVCELLASGASDTMHSIHKQAFTDRIVVRNVSFSYSPSRKILDRMSLEISRGDCVRLIGPNGCGKTTFLNAMSGVLVPDSGEVLIDGVPLTTLSPRSVASLFAIAPQEVCFFSESLRSNVELCCDMKSMEFRRICEAIGVYGLVMTLPNGWDTVIGERGLGLSGGQKQLISLARAMASPAPILILDEPCSHIDQKTKDELDRFLREQNCNGRTIIFASHDINLLADADTVEFIREGARSKHGAYANDTCTAGRSHDCV
jgi:ATP-binding cassette subfamily B protein